ncbi:MAG TPA: hypothetical protein DCM08_04545 [Microscillaceae bacterium]|nr:hypothetical protein [Microscillaceae bacterium]
MAERELDRFFRQKLQIAEEKPAPALWDELATQLDKPQAAVKVLWYQSYYFKGGIAAGLLLALLGSWLWMSYATKPRYEMASKVKNQQKEKQEMLQSQDSIQNMPANDENSAAQKTNQTVKKAANEKQLLAETQEDTAEETLNPEQQGKEELPNQETKQENQQPAKKKIKVTIKLSENKKNVAQSNSEKNNSQLAETQSNVPKKPKTKVAKFLTEIDNLFSGDPVDLQNLGVKKAEQKKEQ